MIHTTLCVDVSGTRWYAEASFTLEGGDVSRFELELDTIERDDGPAAPDALTVKQVFEAAREQVSAAALEGAYDGLETPWEGRF